MLGVLTSNAKKEAPVSEQYAGRQIVGMDLHVRREGARVQWAAVRRFG